MFEHKSGLPAVFDRGPMSPDRSAVVFHEGRFLQGAELNELQTILGRQVRGVGNLVAADGDRRSGGDIVVVPVIDPENPDVVPTMATVSLAAGEVYIQGRVLSVPAAVFQNVVVAGDIQIGVRLVTSYVSYEQDPTLLGIYPGSESEGEPGASREVQSLVWALENDGAAGEFFSVYLMRNGTVIDQSPPPALTGILQTISTYDYEGNGHYIVSGCRVDALGRDGDKQVFSIEAGTANIRGWKRKRETALRLAVAEAPDLETVTAEPHTFASPGTTVIEVTRPPISTVTSAVVTKRVSETVTRGAVPGGTDELANAAVVEIESIVQGGTTFDPSTYTLNGDEVSWAPAGPEPAQASSYTVTYLYHSAVVPDQVTATSVTLSGGVQGRPVFLSYTSKVPRIDLICLNEAGLPEYVYGVSARKGALPPKAPSNLLKIAEVRNTWDGAPTVLSNGTRNYTYDQQRRFFELLETILRQFDRSERERDVQARATVSAEGVFTDGFLDDFYRDAGEPQTAAVNQGVLQLAIDRVGLYVSTGTHILPWAEEVVLAQTLATGSMKINPYANFNTMPAGLTLEPAVDFWVDRQTQWTSEQTREFTTAPDVPPGTTSFNELVTSTVQTASVLRQIDVTFTIDGFAAGEELSLLSFDGIDVTPAPTLVANGLGVVSGTFTIPALVPVGARAVRAEGAAGSFAQAIYVGNGTIETEVMRRVTLITRNAPPPVINNNTFVTENITNVTNVTNVNEVTNVTNVITNVTNVINEVQPEPEPVVEPDPFWGLQWTAAGPENDGNSGPGDGIDPLAQTFSLPNGRYIAGVNIRLAAIGDPGNGIRVQLATTLNGYPTNDVLAEAFVSMAGRSVGQVIEARFEIPVWIPAGQKFCFVVLTDDAEHSLSIARLGELEEGTQRRVSSQPYTVGVLFSSADRIAWTPHQDADLWFELIGARFTLGTQTVNLWSGPLSQVSDINVRGASELPTQSARVRYEIVRASGEVIQVIEGQTIEFPEYITETVTLRAVLSGSSLVSPVVYPGVALAAGRIRSSGTYITRAFPMVGGAKAVALFAASQPSGSSISVAFDAANDAWAPAGVVSSRPLGGGWSEPVYERAGHEAPLGGRVSVTLSGGPGARPSIARLRAFAY